MSGARIKCRVFIGSSGGKLCWNFFISNDYSVEEEDSSYMSDFFYSLNSKSEVN